MKTQSILSGKSQQLLIGAALALGFSSANAQIDGGGPLGVEGPEPDEFFDIFTELSPDPDGFFDIFTEFAPDADGFFDIFTELAPDRFFDITYFEDENGNGFFDITYFLPSPDSYYGKTFLTDEVFPGDHDITIGAGGGEDTIWDDTDIVHVQPDSFFDVDYGDRVAPRSRIVVNAGQLPVDPAEIVAEIDALLTWMIDPNSGGQPSVFPESIWLLGRELASSNSYTGLEIQAEVENIILLGLAANGVVAMTQN